jgi:rSAM/selenodomain-associated transferase 2
MTRESNASGSAREPLLSVVIPALNEAEALPAVITAAGRSDIPFEVIVVDASSSDDTAGAAEAAGGRVISSARRQRAHQLNLGARHARGAILLFLHADTLLPPGALEKIVDALKSREVVGGAFGRHYSSDSPWLRLTCCLAGWRNRTIGWHLGDQAMFVRRGIFFQIGGFRDVERFEDLDFSRRLKGCGSIVTLLPPVISSARRFERNGAAWTTLRDLALTLRYLVRGLPNEVSQGEAHSLPVS